MKAETKTRLGIVLVAYGNEKTIKELLDRLLSEKRPGDRVILVDNHPKHASADIAEKHQAVNTVIRSDNIGFGGGCNLGAEQLKDLVDVIFFLNPDTIPKPGALDIIRHGSDGWSAWMPLLVTPDNKVNTAGNVLHISGLSWVSHLGEPASNFIEPQEVNLLSGACLAITTQAWDDVGEFEESYFMYYEDTDLCLRLRLRGHKLGLVPSAHVVHDYSYKKGNYKFFCLERNRYILIIRTWPLPVILLLLPILIVCEPGFWLISLIEHRFWLRLRSVTSFLKMLPKILRGRLIVQKKRKLTSSEFINILTPEINTPLLGLMSKLKPLNSLFRLYYELAKAGLKIVS